MKKKSLARIATTVLALTFALGVVGCRGAGGTSSGGNPSSGSSGGSSSDSGNNKATVISVLNMGGGVGKAWLEAAFERFAASVGDKSYEEGKTGVKIQIDHTTQYTLDDIENAGYNIYFDQGKVNVQQFAAAEKILDISDIVKDGVEEKITETYRGALQYQDKYYALPHYELFPGLSYDVELFDTYDLYIAAPEEDNVDPYEAFGYTVNFTVNSRGADNIYGTNDDGAKRSCGNDGVYGTSDDGLPSSLVELLALCDKVKSEVGIPFAVAGSHTDYANYFLTGLTAALSGYEGMRAYYTFEGEVECVTGYSNEPIFADLSSIGVDLPKPNTAKVSLKEAEGYKSRSQVERYYALAMLEIFEKAGWFNDDSYTSATLHTTTQDQFIFGGVAGNEPVAMLMELSQWTNEAQDSQSLKNFYDYTGRTEATSERKIAWMPLPTQIYDSVQEGQGKEEVIIDVAKSFAFINANIKSAGLIDACKDFLAFLYTDIELKEFVANTGVTRAGITLDYGDAVMSRLNSFEKSMVAKTRSSNVKIVTSYADNNTYLYTPEAFHFNTGNGHMYATVWKGVPYNTPLDVYRKSSLSDITAKDIFEQTEISSADWTNKYYKA